MAAVSGPGYASSPPGEPAPSRRGWWLGGLAGLWAVVLVAGVFWSVDNDPATVPEQRDIGHAVPEVRRATGALMAAAGDERWVIRLGELRLEDCALNPAWAGRRAGRDVTVYVPAGEARAALEGIANGLPEDYGAEFGVARGGTRLSLHADAGELIAVDAEAQSVDQVPTVRVESGCRPPSDTVDAADPAAGAVPEALAATLAALGAADAEPEVNAVTCPAGGTAATYVARAGRGDPDAEPRGLPGGVTPVWEEPGGRAYRMGSASVVTTTEGGRLAVSVTTGCQ